MRKLILLLLVAAWLLVGCAGMAGEGTCHYVIDGGRGAGCEMDATATPSPPAATGTPAPTATIPPTLTPSPTATAVPSAIPTPTPIVSTVVPTPDATATPAPTPIGGQHAATVGTYAVVAGSVRIRALPIVNPVTDTGRVLRQGQTGDVFDTYEDGGDLWVCVEAVETVVTYPDDSESTAWSCEGWSAARYGGATYINVEMSK